MQTLNYTRLNSISNSVSPYRGSLNRFPIGNRRHNNKYFLVGEENGERVFNVVYGQHWKSVQLTKQEHDELVKQGAPRLHAYQDSDGKWDYYKYDVKPNILGVVRPDNTFEFTCGNYGQGDRGILSDYSHGYFCTDSRRGGMIWIGRLNGNGERGMVPIYHGLRVHSETMRPIKPITVVGRKVDRKVGKTLLAQYQDFYKTTEVMTKAMDYEVFVRTTVEVVKEHFGEDVSQTAWHWQTCKQKADAIVDSAPLDAAILYIMGWDIGSMRWNLRRFMDTQYGRYSAHEDTPHDMFLNLKRRLNKEIYKANSQVFKEVEYSNGEVYPPSEWGYTIMVDGVEVKQYD